MRNGWRPVWTLLAVLLLTLPAAAYVTGATVAPPRPQAQVDSEPTLEESGPADPAQPGPSSGVDPADSTSPSSERRQTETEQAKTDQAETDQAETDQAETPRGDGDRSASPSPEPSPTRDGGAGSKDEQVTTGSPSASPTPTTEPTTGPTAESTTEPTTGQTAGPTAGPTTGPTTDDETRTPGPSASADPSDDRDATTG